MFVTKQLLVVIYFHIIIIISSSSSSSIHTMEVNDYQYRLF